MARRAFRALLAGVLVWIGGAAAQAPGAGWNAAPGSAADLSIASSGEVYAAGAKGDLWLWRDEISSWVPIPGSAVRIAAAPGSRLWGVRSDGSVVRYDGAKWETLPVKVKDVAVDSQGNAVIAREDGSVARWNPARKDWDALPGRAHRIAVEQNGTVWTVAEDGAIARIEGQAVREIPGRARDIAAGGNAVMIAAIDGKLQRWNAASSTWTDEPGVSGVGLVALGPNGVPWIGSTAGAILTRHPIKTQLVAGGAAAAQGPEGITFSKRAQQRLAARGGAGANPRQLAARLRASNEVVLKPPAQITDLNPFEFVDTRGTASRLAIGQDGSVFAIGLDGSLNRWSNSRGSFIAFPGSLVRIAVEPGGNPWGINQAGRIFRHTGTDWRQVRGVASDISIAANNAVMIASATGVLGRFEPPSEGFVPVPGELFFLALAPDGTPWGLLMDGTVLRCAAIPCDRVGREARNISIGPDGSVFIVNFANELRRFNAETAQFDFIPVPGHVPASVAVGPFGRPWVITSTGKVLSSRFFPRDESVDQQTSAATSSPTTGTGDAAAVLGTTAQSGTGFTFSKNMQFTANSPGCATTDDVMVGVDGTVLARCNGGSRLLRYNTSTKSFADVTGLPTTSFVTADVDSEGRIWLIDNNVGGRIFRQRQKNGSSYDVIPVQGSTTLNDQRDLVIGPDGTAYFIDGDDILFRKTSTQTSFTKMIAGNYLKVAVGVANDVWVLTSTGLFQIVGGNLEKRPPSGSPTTTDIGGGADGSIYAIQTYPSDTFSMLYKWNANNKTFDRVNKEADHVDVAPNGRPWVTNTPVTGDVFMAR